MWSIRQSLNESGFGPLVTNTDFLRLFGGRVITDTGDSLYFIGTMWLVWELTGSPFYTGLATALVRAPDLLNFLVGPLVDRWKLRRVLLSTQLVNGIGVLIVPVAAMMGFLSVWLVLLVIPVLYFINGFVYPAQNAALPKIVEKEDLTRANSLFSTSIRTVDMVANAIGGALIAFTGAITLFSINSITFFIAIIFFIGVSIPETPAEDNDTESKTKEKDKNENEGGYVAELRDGVRYMRGSVLPALLFGIMITNFAATAMTAILPAFADSIAGPAVYGLLVAAIGAGTLVGTSVAFLVEDYSLSRVAVISNLSSGSLLLIAITAPGVWITGAFLFLSSVPLGTFNVLFFSMVQSGLDSAYLGRITSVMRTFLSGIAPVGGLLGGSVASAVGSKMAMYGVGGIFAIMGMYYFLHPRLRSLPSVTGADETELKVGSVADDVSAKSTYEN